MALAVLGFIIKLYDEFRLQIEISLLTKKIHLGYIVPTQNSYFWRTLCALQRLFPIRSTHNLGSNKSSGTSIDFELQQTLNGRYITY